MKILIFILVVSTNLNIALGKKSTECYRQLYPIRKNIEELESTTEKKNELKNNKSWNEFWKKVIYVCNGKHNMKCENAVERHKNLLTRKPSELIDQLKKLDIFGVKLWPLVWGMAEEGCKVNKGE